MSRVVGLEEQSWSAGAVVAIRDLHDSAKICEAPGVVVSFRAVGIVACTCSGCLLMLRPLGPSGAMFTQRVSMLMLRVNMAPKAGNEFIIGCHVYATRKHAHAAREHGTESG